jgi:hypothetical protein
MTTDGKYNSVSRKQPEYNVLEEKVFLKYGLILTLLFPSTIELNSVFFSFYFRMKFFAAESIFIRIKCKINIISF